ncbi:MATE family efflux transporter [Kiloniella sp. EL199]|uniref:MATE family efflux transporter n=1 Tax=Kiloniella sp. EL199 TaxID=2107581 RepID=UPI000EA026D7|nr:MATE family efflux transporter [Kiloniella sp. EL199]
MKPDSTKKQTSSEQQEETINARFVTGSILRHVINMTATTSVGLMSIFFVELVDMYFISLLGEESLAAAIGFSGAITFFIFSISIGLSIGLAAVVAKVIGAGQGDQAKRVIFNGLLTSFVMMSIIAIPVYLYTEQLLFLVGAEGKTLEFAVKYMKITVISLPIISIGMSMGAVLRAVGAAKASMISTVLAGVVNIVLDPLFIFTLDFHIEGAAYATLVARLTMAIVAAWVLARQLGLSVFKFQGGLSGDITSISKIAIPAALTSLATPFANSYVTTSVAGFGADAVAGLAIIGRITPFAFAAVFALSAAIGPIVGQNIGAAQTTRVKSALNSSLLVIFVVVCATSLIMTIFADTIAKIFNASGLSADLVVFFCVFTSWSFIFSGAQFIANAAFNNMNKATWSTFANWAKATVGTIPFIWFGGELAGAKGIIAGQAFGSILFGIITIIVAYKIVSNPIKLTEKRDDRTRYFGAWLPAILPQFGWQRFMEERWNADQRDEKKNR